MITKMSIELVKLSENIQIGAEDEYWNKQNKLISENLTDTAYEYTVGPIIDQIESVKNEIEEIVKKEFGEINTSSK